MTPRSRRNACPTIAAPMETGDGLLARLPPTGRLSPATLHAVADAAARFGNGIVEITARGSIQIRGLSACTGAPFAATLAEAGLVDATPAILVPPLAGHDPTESVDARPLADALREAIAADGIGLQLAPKVSVVIDGGGVLHLDAIDADLRLVANRDRTFAVALGGTAATARPLGIAATGEAIPVALAVLRRIAGLGASARGRDLDPALVAGPLVAGSGYPAARRPSAQPVGLHTLRDGTRAVGIGLPFGQTDAAALRALIRAAEDCGATCFAPSEGRALLAAGMAPDRADRFREHAAALGFIVRPGDPRRSVAACSGAPACGSGLMPARAIAADIAAEAAPILDGSVTLHISGCAKGCAHSRAATLTFTGGEQGAGLIVAGRAGDDPVATVAPGDLAAAVTRLVPAVSLARRPGERAADTIARLGADRLAGVLHRETADA